jgi:hypothetical protein
MIPMTARSSTRVNAAAGQGGIKGFREEGVKGATQQFWILNFSPRLRDTLARGCSIGKRRKSFFDGNEADLVAMGAKEVTFKVYMPMIYIVNNGLQSKHYKIFLNL